MNSVTLILKRHSLSIGVILMFLFTWPIMLAVSGVIPIQVPFIVALLVGYGIVLATLLMTWLTLGRNGVITLLKRYLIWRVGWKWYLVPFLLVPFITFLILILNAWISQTPIDFSTTNAYDFFGQDANFLLLVIPFFISELLTNGEEIGWRGYVLPRLQATHSALTASLILGVIWGFWHLPKFLSHWDTAVFGWYIVGIMAITIVYTWLYNNTKGSLLLVALFHAANNTLSFFLPLSSTTTNILSAQIIESLIWLVVAIVVIFVAGPARLSRTEEKQVQVVGPAILGTVGTGSTQVASD